MLRPYTTLGLTGLVALAASQIAAAATVSIEFKPSNFSHPLRIDNTFFHLTPGSLFVFRSTSEEGCELNRTHVTKDTRQIDGITARIVHDVVWSDEHCNGTLTKIEDTDDYYAQDDAGNVWYLGEISKTCEKGECTLDEGSWLAGKDLFNVGKNAKPGIQMLAHPNRGDSYRQEFYPGHAEDQATVTETSIPVKLTFPDAIPPRSFRNCIKTREFTALEPDVVGFKYYCPTVGFILETESPGQVHSERIKDSAEPTNDALRFRTVPH
jgi:hypothetical protein